MKKYIKDILLFLIAFLFLLPGVVSKKYWEDIKLHTTAFFKNIETEGFFASFESYTDTMETVSAESLEYHKDLIDLNSKLMNLEGIRIVEKDSMTVVRANNGYLSAVREKISDESLFKRADNLEALYESAKNNGAEFLYIMAPTKGYSTEYPENAIDYNKDNCDRFLKELKTRSIPYFNLMDEMRRDGISEEDLFFITDHHWKPEYAFWAVSSALEELRFPCDREVIDIINYNVEEYENWFLGSQGKKVGRFFTDRGVDDIKLITPKFPTDLTENQPGKNLVRRGTFDEILLDVGHINEKDYFGKNPYAAYTGGDFREQIITNHLNPDGKKVLVIRDSFACAFTPFLSLAAGETYILDMRDFPEFQGERIDVKKYIEDINPDYVLVLYTGVTASEVLFDF
ncbi:MAG: DHHW family protein [Clostridia bacterium]|nr:DHHW family protein [Clostridia bacterium]